MFVWELKYDLKAASSRFNWSHWGIYAKTFLSDARQLEVEVLHSKAVVLLKFLGELSVLELGKLVVKSLGGQGALFALWPRC